MISIFKKKKLPAGRQRVGMYDACLCHGVENCSEFVPSKQKSQAGRYLTPAPNHRNLPARNTQTFVNSVHLETNSI